MGERRVSDERNELAINTGMLYGSLQDWTQDLRDEREENRRLREALGQINKHSPECYLERTDSDSLGPRSRCDCQVAIARQALAERDDGG